MDISMVNVELLLDSARGVYIPNAFLQFENMCVDGKVITDEYRNELNDYLSDPQNEYFWETWEEVLNNVSLYKKNDDGNLTDIHFLHQDDGNLWAINQKQYDELSPDDKDTFWEENFVG